MNTYTKVSDGEMEVIKEAPIVEPITTKYSIDFLKQQELNILKQMNDYIEQRQKELVEVRELITQAELLGLKSTETLQAEAVAEEEIPF